MIADNGPSAAAASDSLSASEIRQLRTELLASVQGEIRGGEQLPPPEARPRIEARLVEAVGKLAPNRSPATQQMLVRCALDEACGFGPIQPLLDDPTVTEVMVNRFDRIFAERSGKSMLADVRFDDDAHVRRVIDRIIVPIGRRVDTKNPLVDARLPDGSRVNACIPPVAIDGCNLTIRKFPSRRLTIQDLVNYGSISANLAKFMEACVVSRMNIVVSGGTGSGKTTLLNVLSSFIPSHQRIVTIEDAAELQLGQEQVVRLESKKPEIDGGGEVTIRELVRNALRMRPDRIVVGECRGGGTVDMLQAMNTGHDGSLTTLHANTPRDAISRIETMSLMGGIDFPIRVVREQLSSAIQLVIQQSRLRDGSRKITHITEIAGMEGDRVVMQDLFRFHEEGLDENGKLKGSLRPSGLRPSFQEKLEAHGFDLPAEMFIPGGAGGMGQPAPRGAGNGDYRPAPAIAGNGGMGADGKKKGWW